MSALLWWRDRRLACPPSRQARRLSLHGIVVAAFAAAILFFFDPTKYHFYPPCMFHQLTGLQCPGCGATRAVFHLLHGDVAGAFRLNQFLFVVAPFVAITMKWPQILKKPVVGWTAVFVTAVYAIARNLPFWPYPL